MQSHTLNQDAQACTFSFKTNIWPAVRTLTFAAVLSREVEGTLAVEASREVNTGGAGWAGGRGAVLDVVLAVGARESRCARAVVGAPHLVAGGTIAAHVGTRLVLVLAAMTAVARGARAVEATAKVSTGPSMRAWVANAPLGGGLAALAISSRRAAATGRK